MYDRKMLDRVLKSIERPSLGDLIVSMQELYFELVANEKYIQRNRPDLEKDRNEFYEKHCIEQNHTIRRRIEKDFRKLRIEHLLRRKVREEGNAEEENV